jgi:hypothetical protein
MLKNYHKESNRITFSYRITKNQELELYQTGLNPADLVTNHTTCLEFRRRCDQVEMESRVQRGLTSRTSPFMNVWDFRRALSVQQCHHGMLHSDCVLEIRSTSESKPTSVNEQPYVRTKRALGKCCHTVLEMLAPSFTKAIVSHPLSAWRSVPPSSIEIRNIVREGSS